MTCPSSSNTRFSLLFFLRSRLLSLDEVALLSLFAPRDLTPRLILSLLWLAAFAPRGLVFLFSFTGDLIHGSMILPNRPALELKPLSDSDCA